MEVFKRLGIGTANWGKEYNGSLVPEKDQREILDLCMCKGIDLIDTATAYKNNVLDIASSYFKIVLKVIGTDPYPAPKNVYRTIAHKIEEYPHLVGISGASIYSPKDLQILHTRDCRLVQLPYSLFDRRFEDSFAGLKRLGIEIHVRSIFLRGKVLEKVKPYEAIAFCLMSPYVDRVIFGMDSVDQFRENLDYFHWLDSLKVTDENILDPRKWDD